MESVFIRTKSAIAAADEARALNLNDPGYLLKSGRYDGANRGAYF